MDCCLSPHEQLLQDQIEGRENKHRSEKAHARAFKILDRVQTLTPKVDIERGKYFTDSMRETEGQPLVLRWAKAMMNIAENMTVYIEDDQLLVGRSGGMGRYGILYPELDGDFLDMAVQGAGQARSLPLHHRRGRRTDHGGRDRALLEGQDLPRGLWPWPFRPRPCRLTYKPEGHLWNPALSSTRPLPSALLCSGCTTFEKVLKRGFGGHQERSPGQDQGPGLLQPH